MFVEVEMGRIVAMLVVMAVEEEVVGIH